MKNIVNIPKVSVIFPIYNNEEYLERCIRSVLNQTLHDIELILIDDGSTDSAPDICDRLASEDDRIKVIHKENEGSAVGRNIGIDLAQGEYIAFIDPDDYVSENMYQKMYCRGIETNADIVKCGFYFCEGRNKNEALYFYDIAKEGETFETKDKPQILLNHASIWAAIYRKSFIEQHHLRCIVTPSATYSDFSWMAMTYAYAKRITIYHEALYYYTFDNPNSSWVTAGEKCFYKPFHCMESNRILREAGIYENVKEQIGYHEFRTSISHARRIRKDLRQSYFEKLRELLFDITGDNFLYSEFHFHEKLMALSVIQNKQKLFYFLLGIESEILILSERNKYLKRLVMMIRSHSSLK